MSDDPQKLREDFITEYASTATYWSNHAEDLVRNPQPKKPYERPSSMLAQKDKSYRDAFATLTDEQKKKVVELLRECISGSVFSSLVILDQFAAGEVQVFVQPEGGESVQIAPGDVDLHDEFAERIRPST